MDTLIKNKNAVIILVVIILAFFLYSILMSPEPVIENLEGNSPDSSLVELSAELSSITLRQDLFTTPAYRYLVDYSAVLLPQPTGRPNPFNVIGRD